MPCGAVDVERRYGRFGTLDRGVLQGKPKWADPAVNNLFLNKGLSSVEPGGDPAIGGFLISGQIRQAFTRTTAY